MPSTSPRRTAVAFSDTAWFVVPAQLLAGVLVAVGYLAASAGVVALGVYEWRERVVPRGWRTAALTLGALAVVPLAWWIILRLQLFGAHGTAPR